MRSKVSESPRPAVGEALSTVCAVISKTSLSLQAVPPAQLSLTSKAHVLVDKTNCARDAFGRVSATFFGFCPWHLSLGTVRSASGRHVVCIVAQRS